MAYLSKRAENNLEKILMWSKSSDINKLILADEALTQMFVTLECDLIHLKNTRDEDNRRAWNAIKERRKTDKNYAR